MGHDATVTKKRVLGKVEDCVAAVNDVIAACAEMTDKHDALCADLTTRHDTIQARFTAQGTWLETQTRQVATLERDVIVLIGDVVKAKQLHEALDAAAARAFKVLADETRELRDILKAARVEADAFAALGFLGRLRWLFSWRRASAAVPVVDGEIVETSAGAFTA